MNSDADTYYERFYGIRCSVTMGEPASSGGVDFPYTLSHFMLFRMWRKNTGA